MLTLNMIQTAIAEPMTLTRDSIRQDALYNTACTFSRHTTAGKALYIITALVFPLSWPIIFGIHKYAIHQLATELPCLDFMLEVHAKITKMTQGEQSIHFDFQDNSHFALTQLPDGALIINDGTQTLTIPNMNLDRLASLIDDELNNRSTAEFSAPPLDLCKSDENIDFDELDDLMTRTKLHRHELIENYIDADKLDADRLLPSALRG